MGRRDEIRAEVEALAPDLKRALVAEHVARMDEDYLEGQPAAAIARHVSLLAGTSADHPLALEIRPAQEGETFEIVVVAYDYFGEFAILCGLLSSFGLDIRAGRVHTYAPLSAEGAPRRGPAPATRIVDIFRVAPEEGAVFDATRQAELTAEAEALLQLVGRGELVEARDRVQRRLVERLEACRGHYAGVLLPVDVFFSDAGTGGWTAMEVQGPDTPAFLFALGTALSLREVYIHSVEIGSAAGLARDRFLIARRDGGRIDSEEDRSALRLAVGLIKQFTHFLPSAPDPARALHAFDQLVDRVMERHASGAGVAAFVENDLDALAQLLGSSRFLWEDFLRMQCQNLLPLVGGLKEQPLQRGRGRFEEDLREQMAARADFVARRQALNDYKDRAMFLIDMKQLLDRRVTLDDFSTALTDLAEAVVAAALAACQDELRARHGQPRLSDGAICPVALLGLGKFGGRELGYASDVELLLAYGGAGRTDGGEALENAAYFDALARMLCDFIEARQHGIFEIDLRLRPYGKKGPLASSVEELASYYSEGGDAHPFERQALVKLRRVAGDEGLGRRVEAIRDRFVYGGIPWDRAGALHLRARQIRELVRVGQVNVKLGAGGIVDIEYAAQYLQIQYGGTRSDLRTTNTLEALERLEACGVLSAAEQRTLSDTYVFLRRVVEALRMVRGDAKDLVLPDEGSDEAKFLARRLGVTGETWAAAAAALGDDVRRHMAAAHAFYVGRFGEPR